MHTPKVLKRTPLFNIHTSLGALIVPFAGWEMPLQYASILKESKAVRDSAGLFDVSHMGRIEITGPGADTFIGQILGSRILGLKVGRGRYSLICNQEGGILDDCIVYRTSENRFFLVSNAANHKVVLDWLSHWAVQHTRVRIEDITDNFAMVSIQGPKAAYNAF